MGRVWDSYEQYAAALPYLRAVLEGRLALLPADSLTQALAREALCGEDVPLRDRLEELGEPDPDGLARRLLGYVE